MLERLKVCKVLKFENLKVRTTHAALALHWPTLGDHLLLWCTLAKTWWPPGAPALHWPTLGDHLALWCYTSKIFGDHLMLWYYTGQHLVTTWCSCVTLAKTW